MNLPIPRLCRALPGVLTQRAQEIIRRLSTSMRSRVTDRPSVVANSLACSTIVAVCCSSALADDIDVYKAQASSGSKPNIAFVLDFSYSMTRDVFGNDPSTSGLQSRLEILRAAMDTVLDENFDQINAGIASIYDDHASGNRWPVSELSADAASIDPDIPVGQFTVRDIINKQIEREEADGETETVTALAEAALYFSGGPVLHGGWPTTRPRLNQPERWDVGKDGYNWGQDDAALASSYSPHDAYERNVNEPGNYGVCWNEDCNGRATYNCQTREGRTETNADGQTVTIGAATWCRYPHPDAWRGANYISPITQSCQANAIVLISDGEPTDDVNGTLLQAALGRDESSCEDLSGSIFGAGPGGQDAGNCGPEIVHHLATVDQNPAIPGSVVKTYAVGFNVSGPGRSYLERLASDGDGKFFAANDAEELVGAISDAINDVGGGSQSFSQFSIDLDRATYSNDNRAFFSLFTPSNRPAWPGNVKGYFIEPQGIVDTLGQNAVELVDGRLKFAGNARSFWSAGVDGDAVNAGGLSEIVTDQATRNLLTYVGDTIPRTGVNLTLSDDHLLRSTNTEITDAIMGLPAGSALREASLDWLHTAPMGDPLHTMSVPVTYHDRTVLYAMTNQGLLHALDASDPTELNDHSAGSELFAFMPKRLLANLPKLMAPVAGSDHVYGLDGGLTRWHTDTNEDGIVNNGEKILLVFGMRRGGNAYYALDVSDPLAPSLAWMKDSTYTGFEDLAQSWSKPSLITVNHGGVQERVVAFGGGYDAATLDDTSAHTQSSGNAIYMVDESGDLVWSVTQSDHASMQYSIASDLTPLDVDDNGSVDRIYVGDVGGQVWRIDLDDIDDNAVITRFANFSNAGYHPFFYAPSVAANRQGGELFLSIALGSGNRTDPLNTTSNNSLFMMQDKEMEPVDVSNPHTTIVVSDLYDATANDIGSLDETTSNAAKDALELARGWKIDFGAGEKSLSRVVTFEDTIMATTFDLAGDSADPCGLATVSRLYTVDVKTAQPVKFLADGTESTAALTAEDRITELNSGGIASSPTIVFRSTDGSADIYVDREKISSVSGQLRRVFWHAR